MKIGKYTVKKFEGSEEEFVDGEVESVTQLAPLGAARFLEDGSIRLCLGGVDFAELSPEEIPTLHEILAQHAINRENYRKARQRSD